MARRVWSYLHETHFKGPKWADTVFALIGYVGIFFTLTTIVREISTAWPGQKEFHLYLLLSYFGSAIGVAIMVLWTRGMWHSMNEVAAAKQTMAEIGHELAETIRSAAADLSSGCPVPKLVVGGGRLAKAMSRLSNLLAAQLVRDDVTITLKFVDGPPNNRQLKTVHREARNVGSTARPNDMPADASLVYKRFVDGDRRPKWVIVRDVEKLATGAGVPAAQADAHKDYQSHAKQCGFRSLVAFPLRQPAGSLGKLNAHGIVGFLSFDSPSPKAFDKLFKEGPGPLPEGIDRKNNDGLHLSVCKDGQFFYLVTDSLATLAIMENTAIVTTPGGPPPVAPPGPGTTP